MAETTTSSQSKRQREEENNYNECEVDDNKRHKSSSYNQILSILEEEEDEPNQEYMLDIFQSLQQELSSEGSSATVAEEDPLKISASLTGSDHQSGGSGAVSETSSPNSKDEDDDDDEDRLRMMKHLLEASDDELGLPNRLESGDEEIISEEKNHPFLGDGLWEFEDDAADYYTLLQSELFM
ncbi:hypothetical protein ACH5RR_035843 [Cinchona calisaya]|uniref:Uncharacterized protein n=1 Tax=Cinchona calisaya TaxID=153742 RepID=A0ABD2Y6C2_9GENT